MSCLDANFVPLIVKGHYGSYDFMILSESRIENIVNNFQLANESLCNVAVELQNIESNGSHIHHESIHHFIQNNPDYTNQLISTQEAMIRSVSDLTSWSCTGLTHRITAEFVADHAFNLNSVEGVIEIVSQMP